ncbi:AAA family ATPase [Gordonia sp. 'Campus']|uniref:ATP-binding protein n=1 Tax=Gordonia sp. 'Campus' TaxID=2915824 RepID=UPI001EE4A1B4|nr:AAA family ATPase [Gordonia sp. 'Campus']
MTESKSIREMSLLETVWELLDADDELSDEAKYVVIAALDSEDALSEQLGGGAVTHQRPDSTPEAQEPAGAFLREIRVAGFRGIGPQASLTITPYPGITVISGRNGSGKSSFAEALEYALTGQSYRWKHKAKLWVDAWRNLHQGDPCEVRVDFTTENGPKTSIGAQWSGGAELNDAQHWSQREGEKRQDGVDALGWTTAIEIHRPILSYDEIGGLLEREPSKLYDELDKLLALDEVQDAERRLNAEYTERRRPRKTARDALVALKKKLVSVDDERVSALTKLVRSRTPDLDAIAELVAGTNSSEHARVAALEAIAEKELPDINAAGLIAAGLRDSLASARTLADDAMRTTEQRSDLLQRALEFRSAHDDEAPACPVCGEGVLTVAWEHHAREAIAAEGSQLAMYREARRHVHEHEQSARRLFESLRDVARVEDTELYTLTAYRDAFGVASALPVAVEDLPSHIEANLPPVVEALAALRTEAASAMADLQDAWAPIAEEALEWLALERRARETDGTVKTIEEARTWVQENSQRFRAQRLEPISEGARAIWSQLRQESDVEISEIALEGKRTHRKAVLRGHVDGKPAGALSVMSQGELHALALALFLPRATSSASPFRFIVLDDPIQAMDPAKIDGFLNVLTDLAASRQVIVFSHDDRLATAIRQHSIDAHLIEVTRESGSQLVVKSADEPARRYVDDAFAIVADENVPEDVKRRACPGLFRFAIEAAARQVYFTRSNVDGQPQHDTEAQWAEAKSATACVALALHGATNADLSGWKSWRPHRRPAMTIATKGVHKGATIGKDDVRDLRKTVDDILEQR